MVCLDISHEVGTIPLMSGSETLRFSMVTMYLSWQDCRARHIYSLNTKKDRLTSYKQNILLPDVRFDKLLLLTVSDVFCRYLWRVLYSLCVFPKGTNMNLLCHPPEELGLNGWRCLCPSEELGAWLSCCNNTMGTVLVSGVSAVEYFRDVSQETVWFPSWQKVTGVGPGLGLLAAGRW